MISLAQICHGCTRGTELTRCPADGRDFAEHAASGSCPLGKYKNHSPDHSLLLPGQSIQDIWGPSLWRELHAQARNGISREWLDAFTARVPCGDCRRHWIELVKMIPPPLGDAYEWSVAIHNAVNRRLGKPEWPLIAQPSAGDATGEASAQDRTANHPASK